MNRGDPDNPARPRAGVTLCALAELPERGAKGFRFRVDRFLFAGFVVRQGAEVRGYVDSCPHAGWPLASEPDRYLTRQGDRILCTGHGASFRIEDGACLFGPCPGMSLTPWPVEVNMQGVVLTA